MSLATETALIPQRVVDRALDLGAHQACFEADWEGSCQECKGIFLFAFDTFYGIAENADDALMMIINDILEDRDTTQHD